LTPQFIAAAWLQEQARYLARPIFDPSMVVKMTGSNSQEEKARVVRLFQQAQG
jgi:hypothetical protein